MPRRKTSRQAVPARPSGPAPGAGGRAVPGSPAVDLVDLRRRFLATFARALALESDAVRRRLGPAEVGVLSLALLESGAGTQPWVYRADLQAPAEKLLPDLECRLRQGLTETDVLILTVAGRVVTLRSATALALPGVDSRFIVYPWYLYQRLQESLAALERVDVRSLRCAFAVFGCLPPEFRVQRLVFRHDCLNRSQSTALGNCLKSSCAFIWGPPGTGKTTTLARILLELLAHGQRVLVTSNTNAAVDQVLRALRHTSDLPSPLTAGQVVRVGSPDPEWEGLTPWRLAEPRAAALLQRRSRLRERRHRLQARAEACEALARHLEAAAGPRQIDLFNGHTRAVGLPAATVATALSHAFVGTLEGLEREAQRLLVTRRQGRLTRLLDATDRRLLTLHRGVDAVQGEVVREARLVLATAAAVSLNRFLQEQTFDTVVIEEAAMVTLPALFLCAARATRKVLVVGDPLQLTAIVQTDDPFVHRAMGRSIFAVAAPNPFTSPLVSMLEEQYRMHPVIGGIVSHVFYHDRLQQAVSAADLQHIVQSVPFRGEPVVLLDTGSHTACACAEPGPSRYNDGSARVVLDLVGQAVRAAERSIAVITPYTAQARLIRGLLREQGLGPDRVECRTVHRFQGNERDMIILDTVDTDPFAPGVLLAGRAPHAAAANLLNVAISRARGKLIIVADRAYFQRACPRAPVARVIEACAAAGKVVSLRSLG